MFSRLELVAGEYVLWRNRCFAARRHQRIRAMWPLLSRPAVLVEEHLESQLSVLGEAEFLRKLSCPYLKVWPGVK